MLQTVYVVGIFVLGLVTVSTARSIALLRSLTCSQVFLCASNRFARPEYRLIRTANFVGLGLSGFIPLIHSVIIYGVRMHFEPRLSFRIILKNFKVWVSPNGYDGGLRTRNGRAIHSGSDNIRDPDT